MVNLERRENTGVVEKRENGLWEIFNPSQDLLKKVFEMPKDPVYIQAIFSREDLSDGSDIIKFKATGDLNLEKFKEKYEETIENNPGYEISSFNMWLSSYNDKEPSFAPRGEVPCSVLLFINNSLMLSIKDNDDSLSAEEKGNVKKWFEGLKEPQQK